MKPELNRLLEVMDSELRVIGRMMWLFNATFTTRRLRAMNWMQQHFRAKIKTKASICEEVNISVAERKDMRTLVFSPLPDPDTGAATDRDKWPCFIWFHGGGYAIGAPESTARIADLLMPVHKCVVVSPDYCLSPQAPYPRAIEDAYATLEWVIRHADALGIDKRQIFVGGESAGGGLAAALCLYARDKGNRAIAFQMPLYPMLDDRMNSHSATHNIAPVWNSQSNLNAWKLYLGPLFGTDDVPIYAAPSRARNLTGLPPAATFVGDLEPFYDEVVAYFDQLNKSSSAYLEATDQQATDQQATDQQATDQQVLKFAVCKVFKGCFHAFEQMNPSAQVSREAVAFMQASYLYAVQHYRKTID